MACEGRVVLLEKCLVVGHCRVWEGMRAERGVDGTKEGRVTWG